MDYTQQEYMASMLTTDPDGRMRPLYPHLAPKPSDYSEDGLMDMVVGEPTPLVRTTFMRMPVIIDPTLPEGTFTIVGQKGIYRYEPED